MIQGHAKTIKTRFSHVSKAIPSDEAQLKVFLKKKRKKKGHQNMQNIKMVERKVLKTVLKTTKAKFKQF